MKELLSPKQVATSIGVSESSLKRWCDQGVIQTERTPGGHRRIRIGEVIRFLRDSKQPLVRPEVLGLPSGAGQGPRAVAKATDALLDAISSGDSDQSRRLVIDAYLGGASVVTICEELIAPAMHAMGEGWECGDIEVFQEHQACEILNRVLYDLRAVLPPSDENAPMAIGGTPPGDNYRLATLMVELVLVDEGWQAVSLGSSLPFATMAAAAKHHNPQLFWLSFSHVEDPEATSRAFETFISQTPSAMSIVVGGQQAQPFFEHLADGERVFYCPDLVTLKETVNQLRPKTSPASEGEAADS